MSIKTRMKKQQAIGAKTGRDAAPILKAPVKIKTQVKQTDVPNLLPILATPGHEERADEANQVPSMA